MRLSTLVLALASGCASGSVPRPLYCGIAGALVGGTSGVGLQAGVHGWDASSSGTLGAGAAIGAVAGWVLGAGLCLAFYKEEKKEAPPPPAPPPEG